MLPRAMLALLGVTSMEIKIAGVTVKAVEPETDPEEAVMFVEPVARLVARPYVPLLLLMVATDALEELQCTVAVRSWVVRSVKVPVAANC